MLESRAGIEPRPGRGETAQRRREARRAVYEYLEKPESTTDWLAKLYAIGTATGVELQVGQLQDAARRRPRSSATRSCCR